MVEKLGCLGCSVKTRRLSISKPRESHPRAFLKQFSDAVVFSYDAGIQTFDTANVSSMIATTMYYSYNDFRFIRMGFRKLFLEKPSSS